MDYAGRNADLVFNLTRESAFSFKCQRCGACCHNKAIHLNPFETLRLARFLGLKTAQFLRQCLDPEEPILRLMPDGSCLFLSASECRVYEHRPLVCRLFPLGQLLDPEGGEKFSFFPLHPDCLGLPGEDGTVASHLGRQGIQPYLYYESIYAGMAKKIPEKGLSVSWLDVDAVVDSYCRSKRIRKPHRLKRLLDLHLEALWFETAGRGS